MSYKYLLWAIAIVSIAAMWLNTPEVQKIFVEKALPTHDNSGVSTDTGLQWAMPVIITTIEHEPKYSENTITDDPCSIDGDVGYWYYEYKGVLYPVFDKDGHLFITDI